MATGGLRDVVAAQSAITAIDGEAGELWYRGYPIGELTEQAGFEQVAYLLWHGELPPADRLREMKEALRTARSRGIEFLPQLRQIPPAAHPLDALRLLVARDAVENAAAWDNSPEATLRKAIAFTGWFPVVVAALHRLRYGQEPVPPRPDLDTAGNFLWMLWGREPSEAAVRTVETSLVLHADHELNASTFAARVTMATQSNLHAAVISALGTLSGPLHGGASERVIWMLEEIATPALAEEWALERLQRGERIMGFGHAVYRTSDPRSRYLRAMAQRLLAGTERAHWVAILDALAAVMARERRLYPNVDLYAAVVNHALGIEPPFYTSMFAMSRIVGWTAHAMEQFGGRLIRPKAEYIGPEPRSLLVTT